MMFLLIYQQIVSYNKKILNLMFKIYLVLVVVFLSIAQDANKDAYEQQLMAIVRKFETSLSQQQNIANRSINFAQSTNFSQNVKIQMLDEGIQQIQSKISQNLQSSDIPYNLRTWNCTVVPSQDYKKIINIKKILIADDQELNSSIDKVQRNNQCFQEDRIRNLYDMVHQQIQVVGAQTRQYCPANDTQNNPPNGQTKPSDLNNTSNNTDNGNLYNNPNNTLWQPPNNNGSNPTNNSNNTDSNSGSTNNTIPDYNTWNNTNNNQNNNTYINPNNNDNSLSRYYVNNLGVNSNNWIYGRISAADYNLNTNNYLNKGAKVCPVDFPYVTLDNSCTSCPQLYDLSSRMCVACPSGSSFNSATHQCDTSSGSNVIRNSNPPPNGNYIGKVPDRLSNVLTCPTQTPYFNGINCIGCTLPRYFDFSSQMCLGCPSGTTFVVQSKLCSQKNDNTINPTFKKYNSNFQNDKKNFIGTVPDVNNNYEYCKFTQPFFNGVNCVSCTSPNFFDFSSNLCQSCQKFYIFDDKTKECVIDQSKVYFTNNMDSSVQNFIGNPPLVQFNNEKLLQTCPPNAPFSDGKACIICQYPSFYNFQTGNCQICPNNYIFNLTTKSCTFKNVQKSGLKNSNVEKAVNFMNKMPLYNSSLESCPTNAPFFNGQKCIQCNSPSYFNFQTTICQTCPSLQVFSIDNRQCEFTTQSFVTNLNNPNIYFNGDFETVKSEINQRIQSNTNVKTCPEQNPFYDARSNRCAGCPENTPIFNIKYNLCMSCGADRHFDEHSKMCVYNEGVSFSIERAFMNTL